MKNLSIGDLLNPETLGDFSSLAKLVLAGLAVPVDGGCIIQASPLGANFGAQLYNLVAYGHWTGLVSEYKKAWEDSRQEYDALDGR